MTSDEQASHRDDPFAAVAAGYDDWFRNPLGAFVDRLELDALDALLPPPGGGTVVEVGAGTGHLARHLVANGFQVLALEPSRAMLEEGRSRAPISGLAWAAAVAESLPFRDASAEGVLFFTTLEFVSSPARAIQEAFRVLLPGGWLVIAFLDAGSAWAGLYRSLGAEGRAPWSSAHLFRAEEVEALAGRPLAASASAVHLPPSAQPPFADAELAARRSRSVPAMRILLWRSS